MDQVTCPECGLKYVDDADWSGPAHGERDCIRELQRQLAERVVSTTPTRREDLEGALAWIEELVYDHTPSTHHVITYDGIVVGHLRALRDLARAELAAVNSGDKES